MRKASTMALEDSVNGLHADPGECALGGLCYPGAVYSDSNHALVYVTGHKISRHGRNHACTNLVCM